MSACSPRPSSAPVGEVVGGAAAQPGAARTRSRRLPASWSEAGGDVQPGRVLVVGDGRRGRRRRRAGRAAQVLERRARHPQQEQVEDGDEAELQRDGDGVEAIGATPARSDPGGAELDRVAGLERLRALDRRAVDLDAVRRAEVAHDPGAARRPHLGVAARDVGVVERRRRSRASGRARRRRRRAPRAPVDAQPAPSRRRGIGLGAAARPAARTPSRPSCGPRRPGWAARARDPRRAARCRAWIPNSPSRRRSSVAELDRGLGQQRDPLAAGVLEQVARRAPRAARPRSPRTARGPRATARRRTRWARRCATATGRGARPSPGRACGRSRPAAPRT